MPVAIDESLQGPFVASTPFVQEVARIRESIIGIVEFLCVHLHALFHVLFGAVTRKELMFLQKTNSVFSRPNKYTSPVNA